MSSPTGAAQMSFDDACRHVIAHLKEHVPFACWSVSRIDPDRQVHFWLDDDTYGMQPGLSQPWTETFCQYMVAGITPAIAPDAMAVPQYAAAAANAGMQIGAYAGVPIVDGHGALFGTLCGFDPEVHDDDLLRHAPLLELMAALLGRIVHVERVRDEALDRAEELRWASLHDPLTGLTGRTTFLDLLARATERSIEDRNALATRPALVLLDVDDVAAVNDTLGQAAGDRLLAEVAARLAAAMHPFDTVARLGGDEFAILLHDAADLAATADRVDDALREPFAIDGTPAPLSARIGVALAAGAASPDVLLTRARTARRHSTGRWTVHEPAMDPRGPGLPALREAIRTGAVQAVYQPVVRLFDRRVVAYEALARWSHDGVPVPPDVFVPLADRCGLLPDLTGHMIDLATRQLADWSRTLGHPELQVGVNVPPVLLVDPGFPDRVAAALHRHGIGRNQLVLEITEDSLIDDLPAVRATAQRLLSLGVTLVLDDVGAGYSGLRHMRHLPLEAAKIDRAFVEGIDSSAEARHFLRSLLTQGRDLGLLMVVEGVERSGQADLLLALGATHAQGYHFGPPASPENIDVLVNAAPPLIA